MRHWIGLEYAAHNTALAQVRERGFNPSDVKGLVLTHLDFDHAGGIADFPGACVSTCGNENSNMRSGR
ncbi:MAG: MBL fold metallo-hydrolase [Myxococcota bacterium]